MIDYINTRCAQWAAWRRRKDDNGLGFPRECPYTRLQARGGSGYNHVTDEAAWEIECAVRSLDDQLKKVIEVIYLGKGTSRDKARDCRCAESTMFERVHRAHLRIMEWLNDEAAGVPHDGAAESACTARSVSV